MIDLPNLRATKFERLIWSSVVSKLEAGTGRGPQRGSRGGVLESAFLIVLPALFFVFLFFSKV